MTPDSGLPPPPPGYSFAGGAPAPAGFSFAAAPELVNSLITAESNGNPAAVGPPNPSGELALGLMQVLPLTGAEMAQSLGLPTDNIEHRLLDADFNRKVGTAYLERMLQKYNGDTRLALAAYNWGPQNLDKALGGGGAIPPSVRQYASKIMGQSANIPALPDGYSLAGEEPTSSETGDPSWMDVIKGSLVGGAKEAFTSTAQAVTPFQDRAQPPAPDTAVGKLIAKPLSEGWNDPKWYAAQFLYGTAASSPAMAAGAAGGFAGGAAGGPVGAFLGGAGGFAAGAALQTLAPAYQKARAEGLTHDQAVDRAWEESGIAAAFGAAMGAAPILRIAKGQVSNALAQIFIVQPALGVGQEAATTAAEGKKQDPEQLATAALQQAGAGTILAGGHAMIRSLMPDSKAKAPPPPPGAQPPAPAGPVDRTTGISIEPPPTTVPPEEPAPPSPGPPPSVEPPAVQPTPPEAPASFPAATPVAPAPSAAREVPAAAPVEPAVPAGAAPTPQEVMDEIIKRQAKPIQTYNRPELEIRPQEQPPAAPLPEPVPTPEAPAAPAPAAPVAEKAPTPESVVAPEKPVPPAAPPPEKPAPAPTPAIEKPGVTPKAVEPESGTPKAEPWGNFVTPATKAVREGNVQLTPEAMAKELGTTPVVAKRVLDRLAGQGIIRQGKQGGYRRQPKLGPQHLFQFLAAKGGIHPDTEMAKALRGENVFLPGQGMLIRPEGERSDSETLICAKEAGYLPEEADLNDLYAAVDRQARAIASKSGDHVYPADEAPVGQIDRGEERFKAEQDVQGAIEKQGFTNVSERVKREATDDVMKGKTPEDAVVDAIERESMEEEERPSAVQPSGDQGQGEEPSFPGPGPEEKPRAAPEATEGRPRPAEASGGPGEERPAVPAPENREATPDDKALVADKGLTVAEESIRSRGGERAPVWRVTGETKANRKLLRKLGGKWYEPKQAWSFFDADPTAKIAAALRDAGNPKRQGPARPAAGGPGGGEAGGEPGADFWRGVERGNLEPPSAANSASTVEGFDEGLFEQPTRAYGEPEGVAEEPKKLTLGVPAHAVTTAELIARGKNAGIPKEVMIEQIKDIGSIQLAHAAGKKAFVLASETGTGKTFVLGGAIREIARRNPGRDFLYVTMNQRLIKQIRRDLADFGLDHLRFTTYNELATKEPPKVDANTVLIFDEAHNLKNVGGSRVGAEAAKLMRRSAFNVFSSATPFENPVEAEYISNTGVFEANGTTFRGWAIRFGAYVRGKAEMLVWSGDTEAAKAARAWLLQNDVFVYRQKRLPPGMVESDFRQTPVDPTHRQDYSNVDQVYTRAAQYVEGATQSLQLKAHRINTLKRILEASKMDAAVARAQEHAAAGKQVVLFVETKAERTLGRFRKREQFDDNRLYSYADILTAMTDWRAEAAMAKRMGSEAPLSPFAEFIEHLARAYHEAGLEIKMPSVKDYLAEKLGHDQSALYTGDESDAKAGQFLEDWRAGKRRYLIATMAKGGTGLSLHDTVGDRPRAQIGINLPWKATGVDQVTGRTARYGMRSKTSIEWLFTPDIPFERSLAARVGARMADMGATVRGVDVADADRLKDFDFTLASPDREIVYGKEGESQDLSSHFRSDTSIEQNLPQDERARRWVLDRGAEKPAEFGVAVTPDGGTIWAGTSNMKGQVAIAPARWKEIVRGDIHAVFHHNHPSGRALSDQDAAVLAAPGMDEVWAHNAGGASWGARLHPIVREHFDGVDEAVVLQNTLKQVFTQLESYIYGAAGRPGMLSKGIVAKEIDLPQANRAADRLAMEVWHRSGLFQVITNDRIDPLIARYNLDPTIEKLAVAVKEAFDEAFGLSLTRQGPIPVSDRSTLSFRLGRGVGPVLPGDAVQRPEGLGGPKTEPAGGARPAAGAVPERPPATERTSQGDQFVLPSTERASRDELARRQAQRDKELAELRMKGRQRARKEQQGTEGLPLFGGDEGKLLDPEDRHHFYEATWPDGLRTVDAIRARTPAEAAYTARRGFPGATIRIVPPELAARSDAAFTRGVLYEPERTTEIYGDDGQVARFDELIGRPKRSLREKVVDWIGGDLRNRLAEGLADDLRGLEVLERAATGEKKDVGKLYQDERSAVMLARVQAREAARLNHDSFYLGAPKWHQGAAIIDETVRPYGQILDEDVGNNGKEWRVYLAARRAAEYRELGKRAFAGMPEAEERQMVDAGLRLAEKFPQFEKAFADYRKWWDAHLDFYEQSGLLTRETRKTFDEWHKDYVPFHRIFEDDKSRMTKGRARLGFAGQHPNFMALKGGEANIEDPSLSIARNVQRLNDAAIKNVVMLRAEQANAATGHAFMRTMKSGTKKVLVTNSEMVRDLGAQGLEVRPEDQVPMDAIRQLWSIGHRPKGDNIVSWLRGGKVVYGEVHEPMLYRAFTQTNRFPMPGWMKILTTPKRLLTASVVLDPSYWAANMFRDSINASIAYPGTFLPGQALKGLIGQTEKNPMFKLFVQSGGTMSAFDPVRGQLIKKVERKLAGHDPRTTIINSPDKMIQFIEHVGSKLENAPRFEIFRKLMNEGAPLLKAAYEARDLTIDYTRRGSWGPVRFLAETVPFLNASIQGIHKMGRVAADNPRQFLLKGAMLTAAALGVWSLFADDPRYKELTQDQKDLYLHFWVGDQHFKLPIPFEVGSLFITVPIRLAEMFSGALKPGEFAQRLRFIVMNNLRLDPVPQVARPLVNLYANWDDFREAPIVPPWLQTEVLPPERYDERTPITAVKIGRALNVAPKSVEYAIDGYFGNLGAYAMTISDMLWRATGQYGAAPTPDLSDYVVLRRFMGPSTPRTTQALRDFYQMRMNADELWGSIQRLAAQGEIDRAKELVQENKGALAMRGALDDMADRMSKLDKAMRLITMNRTMSGDEKAQRLDQLRATRNKMAAAMANASAKLGM